MKFVEEKDIMNKLNSNHLKLIAIIAMTVDHLADLLYSGMTKEIYF